MSSFQEILDCRPYSGDGFAYSIKSGSSPYGLDTLIGDGDFVDEGKMCCRIPFADGRRRDGVGDILEVGGINLERHQKNALCLFDHGKKVELPIGMAWEWDEVTGKYDPSRYTVHIDQASKQAYLDCYFYRGKGMQGTDRRDEYSHALFAEQCFDLRAKGLLRGGSIGYQVQAARELAADYETGTPKGLHLLKVLMLEGSLVVLPANMDTVSKMLTGGKCCGKPLSPYLVKSLSCYAPPRKAQLGWERKATPSPMPHLEVGDRVVHRSHGTGGVVSQVNPNDVEGSRAVLIGGGSATTFRDEANLRRVGRNPHQQTQRRLMSLRYHAGFGHLKPHEIPNGILADKLEDMGLDSHAQWVRGLKRLQPRRKSLSQVPHYRVAESSQSCSNCKAYSPGQGDMGQCSMFSATVAGDHTCDDWEAGRGSKSIPVPHGRELEETHIPPAEWKPGVGAIKTKTMIDPEFVRRRRVDIAARGGWTKQAIGTFRPRLTTNGGWVWALHSHQGIRESGIPKRERDTFLYGSLHGTPLTNQELQELHERARLLNLRHRVGLTSEAPNEALADKLEDTEQPHEAAWVRGLISGQHRTPISNDRPPPEQLRRTPRLVVTGQERQASLGKRSGKSLRLQYGHKSYHPVEWESHEHALGNQSVPTRVVKREGRFLVLTREGDPLRVFDTEERALQYSEGYTQAGEQDSGPTPSDLQRRKQGDKAYPKRKATGKPFQPGQDSRRRRGFTTEECQVGFQRAMQTHGHDERYQEWLRARARGTGKKSLKWTTLENFRGEPRSFAAQTGHGDYRANPNGDGYDVYYFRAGSGKPHSLGKVNSPDDVMGLVQEHHQKLTGDPLRQKRGWTRPQGAKPLRDVGVEKKPTATGITHGEGDVPQTFSRGKKPPLRGQGESEGPAYGLKSLPLRQKYKKSKGRLRRLKKGIPGRAIIHVPSRHLDAVRREAHKRGVDLHWGGSTNGIDRIRLTGNQEALEEIGGKYGRTIPPRKSRVGKVEGKSYPLQVGQRVWHPDGTRGEITQIHHANGVPIAIVRYTDGLEDAHSAEELLDSPPKGVGKDVRRRQKKALPRRRPAPTVGSSSGRNQVMAHAIQSRQVRKAPTPTKAPSNPAQRNSQPVNPRVGQSSAPKQGVSQVRQGKAFMPARPYRSPARRNIVHRSGPFYVTHDPEAHPSQQFMVHDHPTAPPLGNYSGRDQAISHAIRLHQGHQEVRGVGTERQRKTPTPTREVSTTPGQRNSQHVNPKRDQSSAPNQGLTQPRQPKR